MAEQTKRLYEAMFLIDAAIASADWDGVMAAIDTIMKRADAEVVSTRKWDERRLSYSVDGCANGVYALSYFKALPDAITGLERDVKLNELFLRVLVLSGEHVTDEMLAAPTPCMKAKEDSEKAAQESAASEAAPAAESDVAVLESEEIPDAGIDVLEADLETE